MLNLPLIEALTQAERSRADATIRLEQKGSFTAFNLTRGEVHGADSNFPEDRLGVLLADAGKLDAALIEPMAQEARLNGRLFGDQLIADGLVTPADLASALERQTFVRFARALTRGGLVIVGPKATWIQNTTRSPVSALLLEAFRSSVPLAEVDALLAQAGPGAKTRDLSPELADRGKLAPAELRIFRRLASGEAVGAVVQAGHEAARRLAAALAAMGHLGAYG